MPAMAYWPPYSSQHGCPGATSICATTAAKSWPRMPTVATVGIRRQKLAEDADSRDYVAQLRASAALFQGIPIFLYHGLPPAFPPWGAAGALRYLLPDMNVKMYPMEDPAAKVLEQGPAVATLVWTQANRKLWIVVHNPQTLDTTYIMNNELTPVWQLTDGWFGLEEGFRWAAPHATARLYRAPRATHFEVVLN